MGEYDFLVVGSGSGLEVTNAAASREQSVAVAGNEADDLELRFDGAGTQWIDELEDENGAVDDPDVAESLREIPAVSTGFRVYLLCDESEQVKVLEQRPESGLCFLDTPGERERGEHATADQYGDDHATDDDRIECHRNVPESTFAATSTGSHVVLNGGAYARS